MQAVHDYLANNLPAGWTVSHAKGGYFLWVATDQNVKNFCEVSFYKTSALALAGGLGSTPPPLPLTNISRLNAKSCRLLDLFGHTYTHVLRTILNRIIYKS